MSATPAAEVVSRSAASPGDGSASLAGRLSGFLALTKPRVMSLAVFTAFVGMVLAPDHLDPFRSAISILAIGCGAGAAGMLNMWYDADIDALMARTAGRPIPQGGIARHEALVTGLALGAGAVGCLAVASNIGAAALLAFTIFFYVVVYTMWLKRRTSQNIVIGGVAGALPPVIGWLAADGPIGPQPLLLFLIIFLWTPPHFWALSLIRVDDYDRAGIPMLPVVVGKRATASQVLAYSIALALVSILPWAIGFAGVLYGVLALAAGIAFVALALRLRLARGADRSDAQRLFGFSIGYLFLLFVALLIDGAAR